MLISGGKWGDNWVPGVANGVLKGLPRAVDGVLKIFLFLFLVIWSAWSFMLDCRDQLVRLPGVFGPCELCPVVAFASLYSWTKREMRLEVWCFRRSEWSQRWSWGFFFFGGGCDVFMKIFRLISKVWSFMIWSLRSARDRRAHNLMSEASGYIIDDQLTTWWGTERLFILL